MGQLFAAESGQRNLRVVLFIIILATLPVLLSGLCVVGGGPGQWRERWRDYDPYLAADYTFADIDVYALAHGWVWAVGDGDIV